jgi:ABC-type multidrug transport system fused ATPase/permease subunit
MGRMRMGWAGEEEIKLASSKTTFKYLAGYLKSFRAYFIFGVLLSAGIAFFNLLPPLFIRKIIDEAIPAGNARFLVYVVSALIGLFLIRSFTIHFRTKLVSRMAEGIASDLRRDIFFHMQRLTMTFFDNARIGSLITRITSDTIFIQRFFADGSHILIIATLTFVGVTVVSFFTNWRLTLFAMLPMPILALFVNRYRSAVHNTYHTLRRQWGDFSARINDNLGGIKEIKSFAQEEYEEGRFDNENEQVYDLGIKIADLNARYEPTIMFMSALGTVLVLGMGGWLCVSGQMSPGKLVQFLLYLELLYRPIWQVNQLVHMWEHARASTEHISEITRTTPEVYDSPSAIELSHHLKGTVEFKNVSFAYKSREMVIKNLNFKAEKGERIAIVGPTGSGKTTLASLIPRFYDVDKGKILIDDKDIRDYKLKYLRENIGIVLQDPFLFAGTIKENILYGKPDASEKEMEKAAKEANIYEFIKSLKEEYLTEVGERGVKISGGEKQRIAISRVFLKNPPILILDEATSWLDSHTEKLVHEALERLMKGRTTFIIAHRLSTVRSADRIFVMENGKIVEQGTHKELISKGKLYKYLYKLQFKLPEEEFLKSTN